MKQCARQKPTIETTFSGILCISWAWCFIPAHDVCTVIHSACHAVKEFLEHAKIPFFLIETMSIVPRVQHPAMYADAGRADSVKVAWRSVPVSWWTVESDLVWKELLLGCPLRRHLRSAMSQTAMSQTSTPSRIHWCNTRIECSERTPPEGSITRGPGI